MMRPLMLGDAAKRAAPKAAAHDVDAEANHFPGRDFGDAVMATVLIGVVWVRTAGIRQVKHQVDFRRGQWNRRRVDPDISGCCAFAM